MFVGFLGKGIWGREWGFVLTPFFYCQKSLFLLSKITNQKMFVESAKVVWYNSRRVVYKNTEGGMHANQASVGRL